jgi:two-component system, cell cycle sensor histidine kinase and response regulator CckA
VRTFRGRFIKSSEESEMQDEHKTKEQPISRKPEAYPIRIKTYVLVLGIIWTLVVSTSVIWNVYQTRQEIMDVARHQARVAYEKDVLYRRWNSMHGGVYVPVTEKSPPNPYLEVSERDITSPLGVALTKMNPAYMTRQVHEMSTEAHGVQGHITSLNPIRPANAPDPWEKEALLAFQGGAEEISSVEEIRGQPFLRLMRPLFTENACLSCHAVQGYHLGDIRGGISVSLPMKPLWAMERSRISTLLLGHTFLWLLGLVGLGFGGRRLAEQIAERRHAEESLTHNRNRLERINDCLLELGPDHNSNINRLTSLCGELLGGTCALYSRLDGAMLCSIGQWQTPPDFKAEDTPAGHICYDLICNNKEDVVLITDLPLTSYGESDPNVRAYGLRTYLGHVVKCEGSRVGSLCVVYQTDYRPSDDDRQVLGIIASGIGNEDRRKQAEQSLREREAKLKSIFRAAPIGIGLVTDRILQEVNERLCEMIEYPREELIGQSARILYPNQDEFERVGREKYSQITELGTGTVETLWKKKDGATIHVLLSSTPLDPTDLTAGVTFTALDITERKRAEDELRESERRLSQIIEFLPDAILVIDKDGKVLAWNRAIEAMTEVKAEELIGQGNYEYSLPFYGDKRPMLIDLALHPNQEVEKQYTAIQRRGDIIFGEAFTPSLPPGDVHLSATASVLRDSKGEVIAAIECIRDNTERRRLEERLSRAEKMEALGTLAGGVAHDLNNVLGVLIGYSELLLERIPKGDPLNRHVSHILQSSKRAAAIIEDLLTLARRGVAVSEVVNLNDVVSGYFRTPEFEKLKDYHPNVTFRTDFEKDLLNIKGSPIHLGKTVMNLASNAAEAISGEGEVLIRTENRYLDKPIRGYDDLEEGDYVVLTVSDNGKGISQADRGKMFEPFYTKKVMGRSGTGLGLAVVWGTVKDHDGYIDVQSEEGKGSTFTIFFPVTREELTTDQQEISPDQYMGREESILVVDDVEGQRELAVSMLTRLGYRVHAVSSGEEAVTYIKSNRVDLMVLDMIMDPGIDGLETFQQVLEINPKQKAIIVSGFSETDRVKQAQSLGAGAYVKKPYVLEKLGLAVKKELDRPV